MLSKGKLAVLLATALAIGQAAMSGASASGPETSAGAGRLDVYYTPPVLVRAGEPVRIPVDVVCATPAGRACPATLTAGAAVGSGPWRIVSATAGPAMRVDLSAAAARAVSPGAAVTAAGASRMAGGVVRFFLRADAGGRTAALGSQSATGALRFYVTGDLRSVEVPSIPFGDVRPGTTVLSLPWGSGPLRAGLALGNQSPTVGPSAFDVDTAGRVYLLDELQGRVAVFTGGRLVRRASVAAQPPADIAVGRDGTAWVLSREGGTPQLVVRAVDAADRVGSSIPLGDGIPGQIRAVGTGVFVHLYPLDAWVSAGGSAARSTDPAALTGEPAADGSRTLSVVTGNAVRLATVVGQDVRDAVELRFQQDVGALALAEPDGRGGYWLVQQVWRQHPRPDEQYQFVHVTGGRVADTFAIPDAPFALSAALSKFRIGADGALYQLRTSSSGMRIVRYDIGGAS